METAREWPSTHRLDESQHYDHDRTRPSLLTLPPEILDNIACFAAVASTSTSSSYDGSSRIPPSPRSASSEPVRGMLYDSTLKPSAVTTPPSDLRSFILVCRRFYDLLNINANPHLYARVFRSKFDTAAIQRRLGRSAVSSVNLAQELRRRCLVLSRMRRSVQQGQLCDTGAVNETTYPALVENLWTAYLMLLENDGLNLQQLKWGQVESYLAIHHKQVMLADAVRPGYPADSVDRALALHLTYLLTDPEQLTDESKDESEEKLFVLRPFVFAAHKFNAMFAPWTMRRLPVDPPSSSDTQHGTSSNGGANGTATAGVGTGSGGTPHSQRPNPFLADLAPRTRLCEIDHCGQRLRIAIPILSHGALFSFFMKVERDPAVLGMGALLNQSDATATTTGDEEMANGTTTNNSTTAAGTRIGGLRARSSRSPLSLSSVDHDRDFLRLLCCADPLTSPGLSPVDCVGMFEGTWEGRFSFFDFDSYREMLAGRMRSLYEGPFGEQPQIWKIREKVVRLGMGEVPGGKGSVLGAGYLPHPEGLILDDKVEESIGEGSIVVSPSQLEREEVEERSRARRAAAAAAAVAAVGGWGMGVNGKGKAKANEDVDMPDAAAGRDATATITPTAVGTTTAMLPNDWDKYPRFDDEHNGDGNGDGPTRGCSSINATLAERYEVLLSGTGHSAWGRFVLRGRLRTWDGMLIMTKEYRPDGRGRWLYRGYVVAGGKLVGRWRDTFTPENMSGYEGCFLLHRREAS